MYLLNYKNICEYCDYITKFRTIFFVSVEI